MNCSSRAPLCALLRQKLEEVASTSTSWIAAASDYDLANFSAAPFSSSSFTSSTYPLPVLNARGIPDERGVNVDLILTPVIITVPLIAGYIIGK